MLFPALDVSTSGLEAQRVRMNARSSNIANISTTRNEEGQPEPYRPRFVVLETDDTVGAHGGVGVRVASVETAEVEPRWRWEPGHPDANDRGYVAYPNVSMMTEFTDAMEAARAYEANLGAIEITKDLEQQTLRILA
ncbi:MAG: flagellar basal body rod protein FlgC [Pirellulales bacterium]|nr:flagellar basal body rod protein FlgC [Pirellulales bacterium]